MEAVSLFRFNGHSTKYSVVSLQKEEHFTLKNILKNFCT